MLPNDTIAFVELMVTGGYVIDLNGSAKVWGKDSVCSIDIYRESHEI